MKCVWKRALLLTLSQLVCGAATDHVVHASSSSENDCTLMSDGSCLESRPVSEEKLPIVDCGVYMAPSTLGEETNMGMYTGHPLKDGDVVNFPEIAIPLFFRQWGEHRDGYLDGELWDRYIWEGSVANLDPYEETNREDSRAVFVPGIGCTVNSIMDGSNIESTHGSVYDTAGLHRSKDPGSGAFCPYHSSQTVASTDIAAGAELFASYGDYWIPLIPGAQITLDKEMDKAEDFLRNEYYPWIQEHPELTDEMKQALWELTAKDFPVYAKHFTVLPKVPWKEVEEALEFHKAPVFSVIRKFIREQSIRTPEWLRERGYCQDHIKPDISTIPQAGRGAFATRNLPKGTVVGYSPLIHMGEQGREIILVQYKKPSDKRKRMKQYDLILNYSFGHPNSTVLLTPYGGMVNFINHNKERANVKIRWPNNELVAHKPHFLNKTPEQLRHTLEKIGLSFEYVATRDIAEGEEVFMDYGDEWEAAWNDFVKNWKPLPGAENYVHSTEWEEEYIRTATELKSNPYPENLVVMCIESFTVLEGGTNMWLPVLVETQDRVYCDALQRSAEAPYKYTVALKIGKKKIIVEDVPEDEGIFLYDRAFSFDIHQENVFRHEIMIPDELMPKAWLNGRKDPVITDEDDVVDEDFDSDDEEDVLFDSDDEEDVLFDSEDGEHDEL